MTARLLSSAVADRVPPRVRRYPTHPLTPAQMCRTRTPANKSAEEAQTLAGEGSKHLTTVGQQQEEVDRFAADGRSPSSRPIRIVGRETHLCEGSPMKRDPADATINTEDGHDIVRRCRHGLTDWT